MKNRTSTVIHTTNLRVYREKTNLNRKMHKKIERKKYIFERIKGIITKGRRETQRNS